jgi:hypothetical protein
MERRATAVASAELRALRPAAKTGGQLVLCALAVGALFGFALARRIGMGGVAGLLATELARRGVNHLLAKADRSV